jgi:hypothetical protein
MVFIMAVLYVMEIGFPIWRFLCGARPLCQNSSTYNSHYTCDNYRLWLGLIVRQQHCFTWELELGSWHPINYIIISGGGGGADQRPIQNGRNGIIILFVFIGVSLLKHTLFLYSTGHSASDGKYHYLKNWLWWAGMTTSEFIISKSQGSLELAGANLY